MNVSLSPKPAPGAGSSDLNRAAPVIERIGIVGAGQMGSGIAHVCALAGLPVVLIDARADALDKARATMGRNMDRQVSKGTISAVEKAEALDRITTSLDYADFAEMDFVIEAATEKEDVKLKIYKSILPHIRPDCMLASNTSSISITRLGASTDRPAKFIGMHFMNPVPVMQLVEIIRAIQTSDATYAVTDALARKLGKTTVLSKDMPGFIVNRILIPMINEACFALQEGLGTAGDIDTAMKLGTNQPMGPLALADFIGLDTCLYIAEVLHKGLGEDKYRPAPILRQHVEAGWMGKKTKRGFFQY